VNKLNSAAKTIFAARNNCARKYKELTAGKFYFPPAQHYLPADNLSGAANFIIDPSRHFPVLIGDQLVV